MARFTGNIKQFTTQIPRTLPSLHLPDLSIIPYLIVPALAFAIIALVTAAGVSGSIPNPDGNYPDASGDFRGQCAGNLAVGIVAIIGVGDVSCSLLVVTGEPVKQVESAPISCDIMGSHSR